MLCTSINVLFCHSQTANIKYSFKNFCIFCIAPGRSRNVTEFWKITHMVAPGIFEFSIALLIAETTFKNISKLYL